MDSASNSIDFAKALDLYISSTEARDTYWNLYVVVAIGIVSFVMSRKERPNAFLHLGLAVTFIAFAAGNLSALLNQHALQHALAYQVVYAQESTEDIADELRQKTSKIAADLLPTPPSGLHSPDWTKLRNFHLGLDAIVLIVILAPIRLSTTNATKKRTPTDVKDELQHVQDDIHALDRGLAQAREQLDGLSNRTKKHNDTS